MSPATISPKVQALGGWQKAARSSWTVMLLEAQTDPPTQQGAVETKSLTPFPPLLSGGSAQAPADNSKNYPWKKKNQVQKK